MSRAFPSLWRYKPHVIVRELNLRFAIQSMSYR
jgi:hypothetical protein